MYTLDDPMVLNEEIPDRDNRLHQCIPIILQDMCRNWILHLEEFTDGKCDGIDVEQAGCQYSGPP